MESKENQFGEAGIMNQYLELLARQKEYDTKTTHVKSDLETLRKLQDDTIRLNKLVREFAGPGLMDKIREQAITKGLIEY